MAINPERLLALKSETVQTYDARDCWLYALSIGIGADPLDARGLRYTAQQEPLVFPTLALVLAQGNGLIRDPAAGIDFTKVVHATQSLTVHMPLPAQATVVSLAHVSDIIDRGPDRGALVQTTRQMFNKTTGDLLTTSVQAAMCRGDGGFGGKAPLPSRDPVRPERGPDGLIEIEVAPATALFYRLNGDLNPLHWDPDFAKAAGFPRPILHGLGTLGVVAQHLCFAEGGPAPAPAFLTDLSCRFLAPVFTAEKLVVDYWISDTRGFFEARSPARNVTVLSGGWVAPA